MKYDKPVNVRFEKKDYSRLASQAKLVGLTVSDLVRILVSKAIRPIGKKAA